MNSDSTESKKKIEDGIDAKSAAILEFGKMLLSCGAGGYRVKAALARAAKSLGLTKFESHVSMRHIMSTSWEGDVSHTHFTEQRKTGVNVEKLDRLMGFCNQLHQNMTVAEFRRGLRKVSSNDWHYRVWITVIASAIACAGFCFLNGGYTVECSAVFFAAGFGQLTRKFLLKRGYAHFLVWIMCAVVSTLIYIGLLDLYEYLHWAGVYTHESGLASAILYLIPGFPLTTAMLDWVRGDYQSAMSRFGYCMVVIGSAGLSVWAVCHVAQWNIDHPALYELDPLVKTCLRVFCSFVAAYGFAVLFNAPWKVSLAAGIIGASANTGRLLGQEYANIPWQAAVGLAALLIGILANLLAWKTEYSRVSLSVPAVVIMIPGVPFYRALVAVNEGKIGNALEPLADVFLVVISIGFGLAIARILLDPAWRVDTDTSNLPRTLQRKPSEKV